MIFTLDPVALRHILASPAYEKGEAIRHQLGELVGQGYLSLTAYPHSTIYQYIARTSILGGCRSQETSSLAIFSLLGSDLLTRLLFYHSGESW